MYTHVVSGVETTDEARSFELNGDAEHDNCFLEDLAHLEDGNSVHFQN
jgi:hypothetical protein